MAAPAPSVSPAPGGDLTTARGRSDTAGTGEPTRFLVEVEDTIGVSTEAFSDRVTDILLDERGWSAGEYALRRVAEPPVDFRVTLAHPDTVDARCAPLQTAGRYSCWNGVRAMVNLERWVSASEAFGGNLETYRQYLVNHEVGHALGRSHVSCPGAGEPAPVMMQQTKGTGACTPNGWPYPDAG